MKTKWQTKKLGDLCKIELGKTPARANEFFWDEKRETSNVWLSIADLLNTQDNVVVESKEYLSDKGAAISKIVPKGTLLASFKLTLGRLAFAGRDLFTNEAIAALTISNELELSKEFLFYFLHFFDWHKAAENDVKLKGMTLNKAKLKELQVHLPSLSEQQRIVKVLDEAFDGIAIAKANAEKNLKNARSIFDNQLYVIFSQSGEGWVNKRLDKVSKIIMGQSPDGDTYNTIGNGIPLINGPVEFSKYAFGKTIRSKFTTQPTKICKENDLILCVRGSTTGKMNIAGFDACIGRGVATIRSNEYQPWINYFIYSKRNEIYQMGTGATFPNVSGSMLGGLELSIPELSKQKEIINKIDSLHAAIQQLESIYKRKLTQLEALKKSLLQQAFTGNLKGCP